MVRLLSLHSRPASSSNNNHHHNKCISNSNQRIQGMDSNLHHRKDTRSPIIRGSNQTLQTRIQN